MDTAVQQLADRPTIAVVDYGIGNLRSAQKALQRCGANAILTADLDAIRTASAVVLPGVGAFGACMDALRSAGLDEPVRSAAASGRPFLGICVGMQMLFDGSDEDPNAVGLGIIPGRVRWLGTDLPRPQMQWNQLDLVHRNDVLFAHLDRSPWMYFVHSFAPKLHDHVVAVCDYGGPVGAIVERGNVLGTQFHPEKSSAAGISLLANFVQLAARVSVGR